MAQSPKKPVPAKAPASTPVVTDPAEKPAKAPRKVRDRSTLYASYTPVNTDVITLVPGAKPKQKGTMAEAKFALYGNGNITVERVLEAAKNATFEGKKIRPSFRWDWAHGLIQINGKAYVA